MELGEIIRHILVHNEAWVRRSGAQVVNEELGPQHPFITIVTGSEAKVQSDILGMDLLNRVYLVRNAGNQVAPNLGSIDIGVRVYQTPVVLVLGLTDCDALKTCLNRYLGQPRHGTAQLTKLRLLTGLSRADWTPAMERELKFFEAAVQASLKKLDKYNTPQMQLAYAAQLNVDEQVRQLCVEYAALIAEKRLVVLGALYDTNGAFTDTFGRIILTNLNGIIDPDAIRDAADGYVRNLSYYQEEDALNVVTHELVREKIRRL